jgi:amidohydrolase
MGLNPKGTARATVDRHSESLIELSHRIHAHPELAFAEVNAAAWICDALEAGGFQIERGICSLPTAFAASNGSGDLTIAICAEFDALPDVGHACGHNIIAAAAVAAGLALASVADDVGIRVKVLGTPAEEGGGGKILMLERGAFDDVDAAMMVHPCPEEDVAPVTLAVSHLKIAYAGKAAHASSYPEKGINAADAMTVAQVAIGLLRQHIGSSQRIHGIVTDGGAAPNIVPAHTQAAYYVRAANLTELAVLEPRVRACFEAGAVATGCVVEIEPASAPYSEFDHDMEMVAAYRRNAEALGRVFPSEQVKFSPGSTDMANISLALPSIQPMLAIDCGDSGNHQPEFAKHCIEPSADRALLTGGLAMAWTGVDMACDTALRARLIGAGLARRSGATPPAV